MKSCIKQQLTTTKIIAVMFGTMLAMTACEKKLEHAQVDIVDPIRHYYPVVQGEMLAVNYEIENVSDEPLVIQEVQTTCGCLVPKDDLPFVVLPKKKGRLRLSYDTTKNTGEVVHYVWLYGNFTDSAYRELQFDTNVVPPADFTRDYEQVYHERLFGSGTFHDAVNGRSSEKGYYIGDHIDPRTKTKENVQRELDDLAF